MLLDEAIDVREARGQELVALGTLARHLLLLTFLVTVTLLVAAILPVLCGIMGGIANTMLTLLVTLL